MTNKFQDNHDRLGVSGLYPIWLIYTMGLIGHEKQDNREYGAGDRESF